MGAFSQRINQLTKNHPRVNILVPRERILLMIYLHIEALEAAPKISARSEKIARWHPMDVRSGTKKLEPNVDARSTAVVFTRKR